MRLVLRISLLFAISACAITTSAQQQSNTGCPGVPGACGYPANQSTHRNGPQTPQNGNGTLGVIYDMQKCGLDYTSASQRLGKRFTPQGVNQPAPFAIAGIPACAVIERAYLWAEGSGNGAAQTATVAGPFGTANYPMTIVGQGPDKCWGYSGSYTYRADVTASIGGNGTYNISGILTNPPTSGNDMDGATLLVVWSLPSATWAGRIVIGDGAIVVNGGTANYNLPISPAVCGATTNGRAFLGIGDIQMAVGSLTANGTPVPITWNWWNFEQVNTTYAAGATTANFNCNTGGDCFNLCIAGAYFRTTTCTTCPTTTALTITPASTPATCANCNGSASVTVSPAGSYTYAWTPSGGNAATATGLCPGTYTCTITGSCVTQTQTFNITTAGGSINPTSSPPTNVSCFGGNNGSASVTGAGGTAPYTFSWAPATTNSTVGNTNTATGLIAGTYVVTVTDAAGCTGTQTITITQPPALTSTFTQTNVLCNGGNTGSASITGAGGTGPYTFAWTPTTTNTTTGNTNTATGLTAQTYNVTVTDANGCSTSQAITITEPTPFVVTATNTAASCNQPNGSVTATTTGGMGAPTYLWTPGGYTSATVTNLAGGTYNVVATDANGCTSQATTTIASSGNMTVTQTSTDLLCYQDNSGTASVTITGNTGTVTYVWTPNVSTTNSATGLAAGTYIVDATDPNGCSTSSTITITEPPQLTATVGGFNVSCFGACDGQIVTIPAGGTGTYTFTWNNSCTQPSCNSICAGTYNVTVTDQNGCTATGTTTVTEPPQIVVTTSFDTAHCGQADGNAYVNASGGSGVLTGNWTSPPTSGFTLSNVAGGSYQCVVTDANNCSATATVNVFTQTGVVATMGPITSVDCFGASTGDATATFAGGNGPYTISWNTTPAQTSATATGLSAGTYIVTATDADGCTSTATAIVTQPPLLTLTAIAAPASVCAGQPVTLTGTAGGGTATYTYVWTPGNLAGATQTFIPPASGTVTCDVTDANGCTATATTTITVNPIPVAGFVGDQLSGCAPLCVNFSDQTTLGSGTITQWAWDFGDQASATTQNPNHCYTAAGVYTVSLTVTSNAGCTNTITMNNYIDVFGIPTAAFTAGPQPTTELNPTINFTDLSIGAVTWDLSFGDMIPASTSQVQNPVFTYTAAACYDVVLEVSSVNGCTDSTVNEVCIDPDVSIYVPNTFTPNEDGINEVFFAQGIGIDPDRFELWVFDRWGNLIYYTNDMNDGWDGKVQGSSKLCQEDTYVWKIKCVDLLEKKHSLIGHVNLIR